MRNLDEKPYSPDEQRVAKFFFDAGIGGGDDPVGALIASHQYAVAERNELRKRVASLEAQLVVAEGGTLTEAQLKALDH